MEEGIKKTALIKQIAHWKPDSTQKMKWAIMKGTTGAQPTMMDVDC